MEQDRTCMFVSAVEALYRLKVLYMSSGLPARLSNWLETGRQLIIHVLIFDGDSDLTWRVEAITEFILCSFIWPSLTLDIQGENKQWQMWRHHQNRESLSLYMATKHFFKLQLVMLRCIYLKIIQQYSSCHFLYPHGPTVSYAQALHTEWNP